MTAEKTKWNSRFEFAIQNFPHFHLAFAKEARKLTIFAMERKLRETPTGKALKAIKGKSGAMVVVVLFSASLGNPMPHANNVVEVA